MATQNSNNSHGNKESQPPRAHYVKTNVEPITEAIFDKSSKNIVVKKDVKQKGYAPVENTLNLMTGDISYDQLSKVDNISPAALALKLNSDQVSIFHHKDFIAFISGMISFGALKTLKKLSSESGRIVPSRISNLSRTQQKEVARAIKIARFLGLMPYVDYEAM